MIYAKAGERITDDNGNYLCSVAQDIESPVMRLSADLFTDMQVDLSKADERFPVTLWFVRRVSEMTAHA